jgi:hypothetical protein
MAKDTVTMDSPPHIVGGGRTCGIFRVAAVDVHLELSGDSIRDNKCQQTQQIKLGF